MAKIINTNNQEIKLLRENSDNSLSMFKKMLSSLETIANKNDSTSASSSSKPLPNTSADPSQPTRDIKKGIIFSLSLSLDIDLKRYQELNCDQKIIPAHYIENNPSSRDPDVEFDRYLVWYWYQVPIPGIVICI